ncbi:putative acetyltransferase [Thioploca ingrica]|uniref:Putative acetyltransferase n=1 Tax=Thioploca ingrica TaxID=40754 RepID=A0A090AK55_9GAMM|nr:putative acetyltransferase [Thioploca ingrica]
MEMDPYLQPALPLDNHIARAIWSIAYTLFFRFSPRPLHRWRVILLKLFGATIGNNCHIYPKAQIFFPWNLICEDVVAIADNAIIYNPSPIHLNSHCIISQEAYLCGATHDYNQKEFPFIAKSITIEKYAWICARAIVKPGIVVGEGTVLGMGSIATKNLEPWHVYAGVPAKIIKKRVNHGST